MPPCQTAFGDGSNSHDDAPAIQCALNAAGSAGGGIVFLPQGTYRTGSALSVPSSVTLQGSGAGSIIEPIDGATIVQGVLVLANSSSPVVQATVRDLHINGNGTALTGIYAGIALDYGASHNTITNVIVEYTRAEGIGLYSSSPTLMNDYNTITSSTLNDNGVWNICGQMIVWAGRYNQILNNVIYRSGAARTGLAWGIELYVSDNAHVVQHNIVRGNSIINTGYAGIYANISCSGCTAQQMAWNEISGNKVNDNQNWGIFVAVGVSYQTITGNTVTGNGLDGIIIFSNGNTISNNVVSDNSASGSYGGIRLYGSAATDNVITGNVSQNVATTGQQRGIFEDSGPDFNVITGNNGRHNAMSPGVVKQGGHTIVANNQGQ